MNPSFPDLYNRYEIGINRRLLNCLPTIAPQKPGVA